MVRVVERRLAAILITDVVGYSRMVSKDEAGTLHRLRTLRRDIIEPRITAGRGRIIKSTGDGVLVEFPSSVHAVNCALAIQRAAVAFNADVPEAEAMHMRIGINLGDVVAEPDGDLYGDGVNVAARLEPLAEPGGLCISRSIHDQVRDKLPYRFEDRGKIDLKNIARPIGVFALSAATIADLAVEPQEMAEESVTEPSAGTMRGGFATRSPVGKRPLLAASVAVLLVTGGAGWWTWSAARTPKTEAATPFPLTGPPQTVPGLSLVVLPFANLSNDPDQDFFADGLTEDLTTDLSHLAGSFVIARNTAFTYKGKAVDVKQVGHELGVRYALEGSVRRKGDQVVLNAQLISTETGAHIWADRFEGEHGRLGELQAEFVARLARSLDVELTQAESLRMLRERPNNPTAIDLAMRGWVSLNKPLSKESVLEAESIFNQSLKLDPNLTQARVGLTRALSAKVLNRWSDNRKIDLDIADEIISKVIADNPENALARLAKGNVLRARKEFINAYMMYQSAIEHDQNLAHAYASAGFVLVYQGKSSEAPPLILKGIRLSPHDSLMNIWEFWICHSFAHQAVWNDVINWCSRSIADSPYWIAYIDLAAAYGWLGNKDAAADAVNNVLRLMPGYTVKKWKNEDFSRNPSYLSEHQLITEGLRKAGLPEGDTPH